MAEATGRDFLSQYRNVSGKLKKRFLRKPNVAEASEQYAALATQLENDKQLDYAGFCCLSVAKCEQSLAHLPGETAALVRASRLFLQAEKSIHRLGCPSFEENLQAAIGCYGKAASLMIEQRQPSLAAGLCLELGDALCLLDHTLEATTQYQKAAELQAGSPADQAHALGLQATCKIKLGDFDGALQIFNDMAVLAETGGSYGVLCDIRHRCEVTRVLLLMILQPTPQKLTPELGSLLEKYAWAENNPQTGVLSEDLFLLLQSVVMACQTKDVQALYSLEADLQEHLSAEQMDLMHILIKVMEHK
ncbi:40-kDa huntingtin-associated protein-like isoform X2 [Neocloeon triangulifer]|nr:40-kDa huntingtin-associated protein-like isoform X2 [Neocloeon triangulifer]